MPITNGMGYSEATINKQNGLARIIEQHLAICGKIFAKYPRAPQVYYYIDTNSGCGWNPDIDCPGSPIIFLAHATAREIDYRAHFIDIEPGNAQGLRAGMELLKETRSTVHQGDNRRWLRPVLRQIPEGSHGLLYHDPNGLPDLELLAMASQMPQMHKIDILIRCAGTTIKRTKQFTERRLTDILASINKQYWIIRELDSGDKWQWTFLFGLNWNGLRAWRSQGFHYIDSVKGQAILTKLNYTTEEIATWQQPTLPLIEPTKNTCNIPGIGPSEQKPSNGRGASVNGAGSEK